MSKFILLLLLLFCSLFPKSKVKIQINKDHKAVYNIQNNTSILLYEFAKLNADSAKKSIKLNTDKIDKYKIEKNMYDSSKSEKDSISNIPHVIIDNLPKQESIWIKLLTILIPTLLVAIITFFLTYIPQKTQAFRNTVFDLLNQQNEILNRISVRIGNNTYEKVEFFEYFQRMLRSLYNFVLENHDNGIPHPSFFASSNITRKNLSDLYEKIKPIKNIVLPDLVKEKYISFELYDFLIKKYANPLRNYFRHLYHIYNYLDNSWLVSDKKKLVNLIQARMTDAELYVLFYNGLKYQRMFEYINKYNIVENLYFEDLLNPQHKEFYHIKMKSMQDKVELSPAGKKDRTKIEKEIKFLQKKD